MKAIGQLHAIPRPVGSAPSSSLRPLRAAFLAALVALTGFAALPAQASYLSGVLAYKDGRYDKALQAWSPLAKGGDASAQFNMGVMYYKGNGVARDPVRAFVWFARSAANGGPLADEMLGKLSAELSPGQLAQAQQILHDGS